MSTTDANSLFIYADYLRRQVHNVAFNAPRVGSGVVRIDLLRFLAGCRTRRLNQAYSVYRILACYIILLWFIRALFMYC